MGWRDAEFDYSPSPDGSLVVLIHGYRGSRKKLGAVSSVVRETIPGADVWIPDLPLRHFVSFRDPVAMTEQLARRLETLVEEKAYRDIRVVGHSMGAVFCRALVATLSQRAVDHRGRVPTLVRISRVVLLAGVLNGWRPSQHMGIRRMVFLSVASSICRVLSRIGPTATTMATHKGASFLTNVRLDWAELENPPETVQILGTIDDIVGPADNIDLATGRGFRYLDVPHTGHRAILEMDDPEHGSVRTESFKLALTASDERLKEVETRPWGLEDASEDEGKRRAGVRHVSFVIHGIRDHGYWTDRIARHVRKQWPSQKRNEIERVVQSYGYFGMGPFLLPSVRWEKVNWFVDQYLEARSLYPNAQFSFLGHSNGTYLLAKALESFPKVRFDNVVFAGSVVRRSFDWNRCLRRGQVQHVLNVVASGDWVVAWFPRFFEQFGLQDLGGAGHLGFRQSDGEKIQVLRYAVGDHGAGKREDMWDTIAGFLLRGRLENVPGSPIVEGAVDQHSLLHRLIRASSHVSIVIWWALVTTVVVLVPIAISWGWPRIVRWAADLNIPDWLRQAAWVLPLCAIIWAVGYNASRRVKEGRFVLFRALVLFPALAAAGILLTWRLYDSIGVSIPPAKQWTSAIIMLWFVVVGWFVRKV